MVCKKSYLEDEKKSIRKAAERRKLRAEFWVSKLMGESQRWGHLSGVGRALWLSQCSMHDNEVQKPYRQTSKNKYLTFEKEKKSRHTWKIFRKPAPPYHSH